MDNENQEATLNMLGTMISGTIVIKKDAGRDEIETTADVHPILAMCMLVNAFAHMLHRSGHTGDKLELDLSGGNVRRIVYSLADSLADIIVDTVEEMEEDYGKD